MMATLYQNYKNTLILYILFFLLFKLHQANPNILTSRLCLDNTNNDHCQQIARDQQMTCQSESSATECVLDIDADLSVLTILNPEEAFLAAGIVSETTTVIGEVDSEHPPYSTVVIVESSYNGIIGEGLRGLKFCHPGYSHDERITRYVLDQLDRQVLNLNCSLNETLTELKFRTLSEFFGESCRPGKWTEDTTFDSYLKNQYSSLCQLCGADGCSTKYTEPFNDTLTCLTANGGNVALTSSFYAEAFFSVPANADSYRYLCPDGTVSTSDSPCTWTNQLKRVLVTSSSNVATMQTYLRNAMPNVVVGGIDSGTGTSVEQYLVALLQLSKTDRITLIDPTERLSEYVATRRTIPSVLDSTAAQCQVFLNWTVVNELELNKCKWLQQASITHGLQPVVNCVQSLENDTVSGLDSIRSQEGDITFIDANFGYIARRKNLINVGYPETVPNKLSKIVLVLRNDSSWYTDLESLRGRSICLPEYGGKEWLAFVDFLRSRNVLNNTCDYGSIFSDFVGDSCAPGANAKDLDIPNTDQTKLCAKCIPVDAELTAVYCNADVGNKYFDSRGALRCLEDNNGDYAVIALSDLHLRYRTNTTAHDQFRVVSRNGSVASYNGLEVDDEAALTIIVSGELVYKYSSTERFNDTVLYLRHIEEEFGLNMKKAFKVFESFNHTRDLLFPDSTPGLTFNGTANRYIQNYQTLLQNAETCYGSGAFRMDLPIVFLVLSVSCLVSLF